MPILPSRLLALPILIAVGVCGATIADAYTIAPPGLATARRERLPAAAVPRPVAATPAALTESAVDRDPFHPERRRAETPYRLDPAPVAAATAPIVAAPRLPMLTLHGVASYGGGKGFAALGMPGRPPRLVRAGDSYEGYRVTRVTPTEVTLTSPDTTMVLRAAGASHLPVQP